jgi:hypothetical protein
MGKIGEIFEPPSLTLLLALALFSLFSRRTELARFERLTTSPF